MPALISFMPAKQTLAEQRESILQKFLQIKSQTSRGRAAKAVGKSRVTLWRWDKNFKAQGLRGLQPKFSNCGRRSAVDGVRLSSRAARKLENLVVQTGSMRRAWAQFANDPLCPAVVARMNFKGMPAPLVRMVKLKPLQARCWASADGSRLFIKIKSRRDR
jgi:hypothetical protein